MRIVVDTSIRDSVTRIDICLNIAIFMVGQVIRCFKFKTLAVAAFGGLDADAGNGATCRIW